MLTPVAITVTESVTILSLAQQAFNYLKLMDSSLLLVLVLLYNYFITIIKDQSQTNNTYFIYVI